MKLDRAGRNVFVCAVVVVAIGLLAGCYQFTPVTTPQERINAAYSDCIAKTHADIQRIPELHQANEEASTEKRLWFWSEMNKICQNNAVQAEQANREAALMMAYGLYNAGNVLATPWYQQSSPATVQGIAPPPVTCWQMGNMTQCR